MKKISRNSSLIIIACFFVFVALLFFIRGEKSVIAVHDNLDLFTPQYQMMKDTGTFFSHDAKVPFIDESSRNDLPSEFNLYTILYFIFPSYYAYVIGYLLKVLIAILGAYFLAKDILRERFEDYEGLVLLAGLGYGILNLFPNFGIPFSSIPILVLIIRKITYKTGRNWWFLLLLVYPMISYFSYFGFFILGYLFIYFIYRWIKTKKFPLRLLIAIILLGLSYIGCEYRLFNTMLFSNYVTIRSSMVIASLGFSEIISEIISSFAHGDMHSDAAQIYFVMPVCLAFLVFDFITFLKRKEVKKFFKDPFFLVMLFIFLNSVIYGIYNSKMVRDIFEFVLPPLAGFQFNRTIFFNPFLWYVALFIVAKRLYDLLPKFKFIPTVLLLISIAVTLLSNVRYNDIYHTSYDIAKEVLSDTRSNDLSYEEFFSKKLFDKVKDEIDYNGEWVGCYGFYPAILEYNGFRTIDGYLGYYSQGYKEEFRRIIAPALDKQPASAQYFDNWGARCYLYSGQYPSITNAYRNYEFTEDELLIDTDAFKGVGGRYIISRLKLVNAEDMGFDEVGVFEDESSTYKVYVYRTKSVYMTRDHLGIPYEERELPTYSTDRIVEIKNKLEEYAKIANEKSSEGKISNEDVIEELGNEEEILSLFDEGVAMIDAMSTAYSVLNVESNKNIYDQDIKDRMEDIFGDYLDYSDMFQVAVRELCNSPYELTMKKRLRSYVINGFKKYEEMTEEEKEREVKLKSLVDEYTLASKEDYYVDYNGEEWSYERFYSITDDDPIDDDTYFGIYNALQEKKAGVLGDIYLQIVRLNIEKAKDAGFDSFPEYAYMVGYSKDYTVEDVRNLCKELSDECVTYARKINELSSEYEQTTSPRQYDDMEVFEKLRPYFSKISPELDESINYLIDNHLFDLSLSETKPDNGYTIRFSTFNDGYIFDSPYGVTKDIFTYVHEYGHYNYYYHLVNSNFENENNIDFSEYHSQGMEVLFSRYYEEIFGEELGRDLAYNEISQLTNSIIDSAIVAEFELYAFDHPDSTVDELSKVYLEINGKYGRRYVEQITRIYDWMNIPHIYQSPCYYISYSTSALAALETYAEAGEDFDKAVEKYMEMTALPPTWGFKNVLHFVGIDDIFEEGNVSRIYKNTYKELKRMIENE
ncbi:MAG: DUF6044 family protein [Lachnospiraceae bacterium]|nr:DUF6044 family protein [Lachnospiraceae bacterium]